MMECKLQDLGKGRVADQETGDHVDGCRHACVLFARDGYVEHGVVSCLQDHVEGNKSHELKIKSERGEGGRYRT